MALFQRMRRAIAQTGEKKEQSVAYLLDDCLAHKDAPPKHPSDLPLLPCHHSYDIVEDLRGASQLFHPHAFIVPVLGGALLFGRGVRRESIRMDSERPIALILRVTAGDPRRDRRV